MGFLLDPWHVAVFGVLALAVMLAHKRLRRREDERNQPVRTE